MVTYREAVAIAQVVFYVPGVIGGIFLSIRHGFSRSSGWVLLITFSLLRLIGAVLEIVGINHPTKQVITGAIVCISIGLSPLTLVCLSLMSRVNQGVHEPIPSLVFKVLGLGSLIALCLGVYGGIKQAHQNSADAGNFTDVNNDSKIAVAIFTVIFIIAIGMSLVLVTRLSRVPHGEKRILLAIGLCWPFLTIRYIYAIVADFGHNHNFNSFFGSVTIYLIMAVLMEFAVVVICEVMGFTLHKLPKGEPVNTFDSDMYSGHNLANSEEMYSREASVPLNHGSTDPKMYSKRQAKGPISWLYLQAKDALESRR